jgi:hypothetical protein
MFTMSVNDNAPVASIMYNLSVESAFRYLYVFLHGCNGLMNVSTPSYLPGILLPRAFNPGFEGFSTKELRL